ncbi:hypothetical protein E4T56_gene8384, partial [Termitomyces sp. T112]
MGPNTTHASALRERYDPDWIPSWINTSKGWLDCEDAVHIPNYQVLDATRADSSLVVLKRVDTERYEMRSLSLIISLRTIYLQSSNSLLMPYLFKVDFPPFETIGEAIGFFKQVFEGLLYMHENHIIHGDCKSNNVMADTACLFDSPPHPSKKYMKRDFSGMVSKQTSRTLKPVKYYLIDFGLAEIYRPQDAPFLRQGPWGGDKTVPEHLVPDALPCDPFAVDV